MALQPAKYTASEADCRRRYRRVSQKEKKKKVKNEKEEEEERERERERMLFNAPSELGRGAFTPENFPLRNNGYTRVIAFSPLLSLPAKNIREARENETEKTHPSPKIVSNS